MSSQQLQNSSSPQRMQVIEDSSDTDQVTIKLEQYDEHLGWYTAGSMNIPRSQLPLLEQAIKRHKNDSTGSQDTNDTVIPFPTVS